MGPSGFALQTCWIKDRSSSRLSHVLRTGKFITMIGANGVGVWDHSVDCKRLVSEMNWPILTLEIKTETEFDADEFTPKS